VIARRVIVTRTGGFAGLRVSAEIEDPVEAERVSAAVHAAAERPAGGARDDFTYEFTIQHDAGTSRVELTGAQLTEELRPKVRSLLDRSTSR
jgi:hypothetical protein